MRSQEVRRLPEAASAIQTQSSGIAALVPKQRAASFWESLFSGAFPFFVRYSDASGAGSKVDDASAKDTVQGFLGMSYLF